MKTSKIKILTKTLVKRYISKALINEVSNYKDFFRKRSELVQPDSTPTWDTLTKQTSLIVDLQKSRQRIVYIMLNVRKARGRFKIFEKEIRTGKLNKEWRKCTNKELREDFIFIKCKPLAKGMITSGMLLSMCETVISDIDSHVWALKSVNKTLESRVTNDDND